MRLLRTHLHPKKVKTKPVLTVIGAGMAGLSAAATLEAQNRDNPDSTPIDYVVLESTDRIGGRVRSTTMGVPNNTRTVEDGANWIYGNVKDNPLLDLIDETDFNAPFNDYSAYIVYFRNVSTVQARNPPVF